MAELTPEAKAEIAEAIRIVREDRSYAMLKDIHSRKADVPGGNPPGNPPAPGGPPANPGDPPPNPPPPADPPKDPPKKAGLWWGDRLEGE